MALRPELLRPIKSAGYRTFVEEVIAIGRDRTPILAGEVDADLRTIYDAWNDPTSTFLPGGPASGDFLGSDWSSPALAPGAVTRPKLAPDILLLPPATPPDLGSVLAVGSDQGVLTPVWQAAALPPAPTSANVGQVLTVVPGPALDWAEGGGGGGGGGGGVDYVDHRYLELVSDRQLTTSLVTLASYDYPATLALMPWASVFLHIVVRCVNTTPDPWENQTVVLQVAIDGTQIGSPGQTTLTLPSIPPGESFYPVIFEADWTHVLGPASHTLTVFLGLGADVPDGCTVRVGPQVFGSVGLRFRGVDLTTPVLAVPLPDSSEVGRVLTVSPGPLLTWQPGGAAAPVPLTATLTGTLTVAPTLFLLGQIAVNGYAGRWAMVSAYAWIEGYQSAAASINVDITANLRRGGTTGGTDGTSIRQTGTQALTYRFSASGGGGQRQQLFLHFDMLVPTVLAAAERLSVTANISALPDTNGSVFVRSGNLDVTVL